jgi:hypothetical protein
MVYLAVIGIGAGMSAQTTRIAAQAAVESKDIAVVTTLTNLCLTVGGLVGIAVNSAIFGSKLTTALEQQLGSVPGMSVETMHAIANDVYVLRQQTPEVQTLATAAYWEAFKLMFTVTCPLAAVTFLLALCMERRKLDKHKPPTEEEMVDAQVDSQ